MNPELIPSPDVLGFPAPPLAILVLMIATLAVHWLFIGATVGGAAMVLISSHRRDEASARASHAVLVFLPFLLSMGVTMGIAPLLFVQVLYGNLFYSANVLLAAAWLGVVPLVIANLYLFYIARNRIKSGKGLRPVLPGVMMAIFVVLATVLVSNSSLLQNPPAWQAAYAGKGLALFMGDLVPHRLVFALLGFLAFGAYVVAVLAHAGQLRGVDHGGAILRRGLAVAIAAAIAQAVAGAVLLAAVPMPHKHALFAGQVVPLFTYAAGAAVLIMPVLLVAARRRPTWPRMIAPGVVALIGAIGIAVGRDQLRQSYVEKYFNLNDVAVHPQWGAVAFFAVFLLLGLAAIVAMLKLAKAKVGA